MAFPYNLYLAALLSTFFTTLIALPAWRRWCLRTGLVDDPGHRKIHDRPTPLAGGLAVATGLLLPTVFAAAFFLVRGRSGQFESSPVAAEDPSYLLWYGTHKRALQLGGILAGALGMLVLGWLDDKHELRPRAKFVGQVSIALLVAASGARITLFVPSLVFSYFVTTLWMLTVINAFNFMDNMNGLCAGLGSIAACFFGLISAVQGHYLVAALALAVAGSLLGFLPYNFPGAWAFLGDAGSHLVGYLLAVLAVLPHFHTATEPRPWAVLLPLLILAVPLADMAWVVLLRTSKGKPFYIGDTNHLSHRLVRAGLSRPRAVLLIWLLGMLAGIAACTLLLLGR